MAQGRINLDELDQLLALLQRRKVARFKSGDLSLELHSAAFIGDLSVTEGPARDPAPADDDDIDRYPSVIPEKRANYFADDASEDD